LHYAFVSFVQDDMRFIAIPSDLDDKEIETAPKLYASFHRGGMIKFWNVSWYSVAKTNYSQKYSQIFKYK